MATTVKNHGYPLSPLRAYEESLRAPAPKVRKPAATSPMDAGMYADGIAAVKAKPAAKKKPKKKAKSPRSLGGKPPRKLK